MKNQFDQEFSRNIIPALLPFSPPLSAVQNNPSRIFEIREESPSSSPPCTIGPKYNVGKLLPANFLLLDTTETHYHVPQATPGIYIRRRQDPDGSKKLGNI